MCRIYTFLYKIIPLKSFQHFLIRKHFSWCARCGLDENLDDQIKNLFQPSFDWIKQEDILWPRILADFEPRTIRKEETRRRILPQPVWQWALAGLAFVCLIGLYIILLQVPDRQQLAQNRVHHRMKITYAKIKGKDAKSYVYQTSKKTFILFLEMDKREE